MKFELRRWKLKYADDLWQNADNTDVARWMGDDFPSPFTVEDAVTYIDANSDDEDAAIFSRAIIVDGHAVGSVSIAAGNGIHSRTAELRFWLTEKYWRCGIMTEAVRTMCRDAFDRMGIVRIYALPFEKNIPARHVLNNAGFRMEGIAERSAVRNGTEHNECVYARLSEKRD